MNVLFIGAHPDDAEIRAGGFLLKVLERGGKVKVISMTNGNCGGVAMTKEETAEVRKRETAAVTAKYGIIYEILNNNDGELTADLENRKRLVRCIRKFKPDVILTHRPVDYHADHRYTSILVQDASYLLSVEMFCSDEPALETKPVILHCFDNFSPEFEPDLFVDISSVVHDKFRMLACHESQVYGFMPRYNKTTETLPKNETERVKWLEGELNMDYVKKVAVNECRIPQGLNNEAVRAVKYRSQIDEKYGKENQVIYAEVFKSCEYGKKLTEEVKKELFPF